MAKILVIEEDAAVRRLLEMLLAAEGHGVVTTAPPMYMPGAGARPDAAIVDVLAPNPQVLTGLLAYLQASPPIPWIALCDGALTAEVDLHSVARAMGAVQVLHKPFRAAALREACCLALAPKTA